MKNKGFTLFELMVTVTIMLIMTGVVLFNYNKFNDSSLMNAVAYDMSLTIRQAQVYGVSTKEGTWSQSAPISTANADLNDFKSAYGVHFVDGANSFLMFIDVNKDGEFDTGDGDTELQSYTFQRGIIIRRLCFVPDYGNSDTCATGSGGLVGSSGKSAVTLDITFLRPDPEAKISPKPNNDSGVSAATIYLQSPSGILKSVVIYSTGQISVQ